MYAKSIYLKESRVRYIIYNSRKETRSFEPGDGHKIHFT